MSDWLDQCHLVEGMETHHAASKGLQNGGDGGTATTHDWLTPPEIISALGPFDMDPCASQYQPWRTAKNQFTIADDGLARDWQGSVWCNPPYGPHAEKFLKRMSEHGDGIALIFARTETKAFQEYCWKRASGMLFIAGRIKFRLPGGGASGRAGAPSVLIAYGQRYAKVFQASGIAGYFVPLYNSTEQKPPEPSFEFAEAP